MDTGHARVKYIKEFLLQYSNKNKAAQCGGTEDSDPSTIISSVQVYKTFHAAVAQSGGAEGSDPSAGNSSDMRVSSLRTRSQVTGSNPAKDYLSG